MNTNFKQIETPLFEAKIFDVINKGWFLLTAGNPESYNTMTASWGSLGTLWNLHIAISFIRPQRHTFGFANSSDKLTLSFFPESKREVLKFCGKYSGKDYDKVKETGISIFETPNGGVSFNEASFYLDTQKLFVSDMKEENFLIKELISKNYPNNDFHRIFISEVKGIYTNSEQ
jgi:flavin reductase (DIM6/NTAB) family NADH-FMN oxidoreductase RutF